MDLKEAQRVLSELGYYSGPMDGNVTTKDFRTSLAKFQSDKRLVADGVYGEKSETSIQRFLDAEKQIGHLGRLRVFRITSYYVTSEDEYPGLASIPVLDRNYKQIAKVSPLFFAHTALEGTGKLRDGRIINVDKIMAPPASFANAWDPVISVCRQIFPKHPAYGGVVANDAGVLTGLMSFTLVTPDKLGVGYGMGHGNLPYNPFKSVASDIGAYNTSEPKYRGRGGLVPVGTKVLIADLIGTQLPDGTTHDGWIVANDTGSAIGGAHFDLFTGTKSFASKYSPGSSPVPYYYPSMGHIWFDGIENKIPQDYHYGLVAF